MAKYVFQVPRADSAGDSLLQPVRNWRRLTSDFGAALQEALAAKFGLFIQVYSEEDGVELDEGCAGMGKDWFNFRFRVFANCAIYLDMINIPYEYRGKGIGEYLVEELKNFAGEKGLSYIFLGSYDPANPFWENNGFKKITEYPDFVIGIDGQAK
jgi:GNAT superfamily N-acetyltransferase